MSEPADPTKAPAAAAPAAQPEAPVAPPAAAEAPAPKPAAKRSFWAQPRPAAPAQPAAANPAPEAPAAPTAAPRAQKVAIPARVAKELDALRADASKAKAAGKQLEAYRETLAAYATRELAGVPDAIKAMVAKRAGADPREQLALLNDLREAGLVGAPAATPQQAAAAKLAPAATTAAPAAPKPGDAADADLAAYQAWRAAKSKGADLIAARMRNDPTLGPRIERGAAKAAGN